ncbi:MAG TPA: WecB/TagA/CpsF family glycosyltransferase [Ignavibacteria bacterium]|nr:WecB/TagA/CpsF family glycosyltransferase [Ignavibacteria bacterium]HMR39839.1 WecB/TagA/CpsF family glycosyltransferase [Ignavibacteria bacterium]
MNAHRNSPMLKIAINNSFMSLPDGRPISLLANLKGIKDIDRVAGPDFMNEIFRKTSGTCLRHFFLGDTNEILEKLENKIRKKYDLQFAGSFSPEFGMWTSETDEKIIKLINDSGADFIWVALGGGKQEIWMNENYHKLNKGIMTGVGAGFRFFTGDIKRAPLVFQRLGFEWLFRLMQQPGKMFKRYMTTLPFFVVYSFEELILNKSNLPVNSK